MYDSIQGVLKYSILVIDFKYFSTCIMKDLAKACIQVWEETGHEAVKYTKDT